MEDRKKKILEWFAAPVPNINGIVVSSCVALGAVLIGYLVISMKGCRSSNSTGGCGFVGVLIILTGLGILLYQIRSYVASKKRYEARPQDSEMDSWLDEDLEKLYPHALAKCDVSDNEIVADAVLITGPRFWDLAGAPFYWRAGRDGIVRFTPINATIVNFTQNQLLAYNCVFDWINDNLLNERTDEYFYQDVVSVSTKEESTSLGDIKLDSAESFVLTTSGGNSIEVFLRDPKLAQQLQREPGDIPTTRAEKAITAIRKMLREKKK